MSDLLDFSSKKRQVTATSLKTFADMLDVGFRYIIKRPHVNLGEIVTMAAHRLASFISICPWDKREEFLAIAIHILNKYYRDNSKK